MANAIARLKGGTPETLNASNCANPRFSGSLGGGASAPVDPQEKAQAAAAATRTTAAGGSTVTTGPLGSNASDDQSVDPATGGTYSLRAGDTQLSLRKPAPLGYRGPGIPSPNALPALLLLIAGIAPGLLFRRRRATHRRTVV